MKKSAFPNSKFQIHNSIQSAMAFVALGSNLGDSRENVLRALGLLQSLSGLPLRRSSLWETTPVDCPPGSARFINAVAGLAPCAAETPQSLLARLHALEKQLGRTPKEILNEPRVIDLDLIAFGAQTMEGPDLVLPHPRAHLRRFVLQPLSEIAPDYILPGQRNTVAQLLQELVSPETLRRVADPFPQAGGIPS
ncbi:MAG: 2-amino-4-hydroxy-6-hydroxymethyldihydropteridine diphosphokinase [Verrucomicrobiota bacterium]